MRRVAFALGFGIGLERRLQFIGNADVVHHQTARLVLEHPIDPRNRLHQVVALHGLVDVHRVAARRIKACQPHIAHDHQLHRILGVLEALFQSLLYLLAIQVGLQQFLVGR